MRFFFLVAPRPKHSPCVAPHDTVVAIFSMCIWVTDPVLLHLRLYMLLLQNHIFKTNDTDEGSRNKRALRFHFGSEIHY